MLMHFFDDKMTRTRDYLGLQARKENSSFCMKKINHLNFRANSRNLIFESMTGYF